MLRYLLASLITLTAFSALAEMPKDVFIVEQTVRKQAECTTDCYTTDVVLKNPLSVIRTVILACGNEEVAAVVHKNNSLKVSIDFDRPTSCTIKPDGN